MMVSRQPNWSNRDSLLPFFELSMPNLTLSMDSWWSMATEDGTLWNLISCSLLPSHSHLDFLFMQATNWYYYIFSNLGMASMISMGTISRPSVPYVPFFINLSNFCHVGKQLSRLYFIPSWFLKFAANIRERYGTWLGQPWLLSLPLKIASISIFEKENRENRNARLHVIQNNIPLGRTFSEWLRDAFFVIRLLEYRHANEKSQRQDSEVRRWSSQSIVVDTF